MSGQSDESTRLAALVDGLNARLEQLLERVSTLEAQLVTAAAHPAPSPGAPPALPAIDPSIDERTVMILGAAVAAFLGERAPIRQIRLLGSPTWAQQGRVTIHASHALNIQHD